MENVSGLRIPQELCLVSALPNLYHPIWCQPEGEEGWVVRATEGSSFPRGTPRCTGTHINTSQVMDSPPPTGWHTYATSPWANKQAYLWGCLLGHWGSTEGGWGPCGGWYWALGVN